MEFVSDVQTSRPVPSYDASDTLPRRHNPEVQERCPILQTSTSS
jgi:hypothetical protein